MDVLISSLGVDGKMEMRDGAPAESRPESDGIVRAGGDWVMTRFTAERTCLSEPPILTRHG
jgi:hypothetical protein